MWGGARVFFFRVESIGRGAEVGVTLKYTDVGRAVQQFGVLGEEISSRGFVEVALGARQRHHSRRIPVSFL